MAHKCIVEGYTLCHIHKVHVTKTIIQDQGHDQDHKYTDLHQNLTSYEQHQEPWKVILNRVKTWTMFWG